MMVLFVDLCSAADTWISDTEISFNEEVITTEDGKRGYPIGTVAIITCFDGYDLSVPSSITCLDNERWSSLEIRCDPSKNKILHLL